MGISSLRSCACGQQYDAKRWATLPLFARLDAMEITPNVTSWPDHLIVEVRVCLACERKIARLVEKSRLVKGALQWIAA
jgi:hypothetical protein